MTSLNDLPGLGSQSRRRQAFAWLYYAIIVMVLLGGAVEGARGFAQSLVMDLGLLLPLLVHVRRGNLPLVGGQTGGQKALGWFVVVLVMTGIFSVADRINPTELTSSPMASTADTDSTNDGNLRVVSDAGTEKVVAAVPTPRPTRRPRPTKAPEVATIGDRVDSAGIAVTLHEVVQYDSIDIWEPDPGNVFVAVDVSIENVDRDSTPFNPMYLTLKDQDGREYDQSVASFSLNGSLSSGELIKGDKVRGWVAFEVPEAPSAGGRLTLVYEPIVIFGGYEPIRFRFTY